MPDNQAPVVLFYTDNGVGLGHLTRQAAVASRAKGRFVPLFVTMSVGFTLLRNLGIASEYFPSYGQLGITKREWEPLVAARLAEAIELFGVEAVVIDHVSPPHIFRKLRSQTPNVKFVWSRRGLWQSGKNAGALKQSRSFDLVVEPGDLASPIDQGPTTQFRASSTHTEPIVLIDREEFLPRDEARERLSLPLHGPTLLVSLGDSDPDEWNRMITHTRSVVSQVAGETTHRFAPLHPLHTEEGPALEGVHRLPVYPVARFLNAFDGAISTAGYNSFHEIVGSGLPAVFVPHRGASIDDQARRAEFASLSGRAQWAPTVFGEEFTDAVRQMLRPTEPALAASTTELLGSMRGAQEFADILSKVVADPPNERTSSADDVHDATVKHGGMAGTGRDLLVATHLDDDQLSRLVSTMDETDLEKTVVAVSQGDPQPLYDRGVVFESILNESEWSSMGTGSYQEYVDMRLTGMRRRFGVRDVVTAPSPES